MFFHVFPAISEYPLCRNIKRHKVDPCNFPHAFHGEPFNPMTLAKGKGWGWRALICEAKARTARTALPIRPDGSRMGGFFPCLCIFPDTTEATRNLCESDKIWIDLVTQLIKAVFSLQLSDHCFNDTIIFDPWLRRAGNFLPKLAQWHFGTGVCSL